MGKGARQVSGCLACGCLLAFPALGSEVEDSLRLGAVVVPFLGGGAGSGEDSPDYREAFDPGIGIGLEFARRYPNRLSLVAGVGYARFPGGSHEEISFSALEVMPLYLGAKYHFPVDDPAWGPYVRAEAGAARLGSVDVSFAGFSSRYWESSWVGLFGAGAGVEYRLDSLSIYAEVRARYLGKPDSALGPSSDAESSWSLPLSVGVAFRF